jgi:hypothetical protein
MDEWKKLECYQCGTHVYELSPRSRCVNCEYSRGNFNEAEIENLRAAAYNVVTKYSAQGIAKAIYQLKKALQ